MMPRGDAVQPILNPVVIRHGTSPAVESLRTADEFIRQLDAILPPLLRSVALEFGGTVAESCETPLPNGTGKVQSYLVGPAAQELPRLSRS